MRIVFDCYTHKFSVVVRIVRKQCGIFISNAQRLRTFPPDTYDSALRRHSPGGSSNALATLRPIPRFTLEMTGFIEFEDHARK